LKLSAELPKQLQQVERLPLSPVPSDPSSISIGENGQILHEPQHHSHHHSHSNQESKQEEHLPPAGPSDASFSQSSSNLFTRDPQYSSKYSLLQSFYEDKQRSLCGDKTGMPLIVSINRTVSAIVGRPISLTAEFCCQPRPRKVFWIHRHLAMSPGRIIGPYVTKNLVPVSLCLFY
jgi:hypothetical protein